MKRWGALALASLVAAVATPACSDKQSTALVVALSSEASVPDEIDALTLEVKRGDRVTFAQRYVVDRVTHQASLPGTLTLEPLADESMSDPIHVSVRAEQNGEQVSLRSATMKFVKEKQKLVRMVIRYSCIDFPMACDEGQTCLGGRCGSDTIDAAKLPDFTGGNAFPSVSQGGCFDGSDEACGASLTDIDMTAFVAAGCQYAVPGAVDTSLLNVFAYWKEHPDKAHGVVLDRDPDVLPAGQFGEGWALLAPATIRLADGLCDLVKSGSLLGVAYNVITDCPTKKLEQPVCQLDQGSTTKLSESECMQCTYFEGQAGACFPSTPDANSLNALNCAKNCAFDGHYNTTSECQAGQACFFACFAPFPSCAGGACDGYEAAAAWSTCLGKLPPLSTRCPGCFDKTKRDNVLLCSSP